RPRQPRPQALAAKLRKLRRRRVAIDRDAPGTAGDQALQPPDERRSAADKGERNGFRIESNRNHRLLLEWRGGPTAAVGGRDRPARGGRETSGATCAEPAILD